MSKNFAIYGLVMGVVMMGLGVLIAVNPPETPMIKDNKYVVSVILLLYGLFRIYRSYVALKQHQDEGK